MTRTPGNLPDNLKTVHKILDLAEALDSVDLVYCSEKMRAKAYEPIKPIVANVVKVPSNLQDPSNEPDPSPAS